MEESWWATTRGDGSGNEWPPQVLGSSVNQININIAHKPFARHENQMCDANTQYSRKLNPLKLAHSEPSKIDVNNSFLAFLSTPLHHPKVGPFQHSKTELNNSLLTSLSGPSHQLKNEPSQFPHPTYEGPPNSHVSGFDIMANNLSSGVHVTHLHATDVTDFSGQLMKNEPGVPFASLQNSRPWFGQSYVSLESIEVPQPVPYSCNSYKLGAHNTLQGKSTMAAVSSFAQGHNTDYFHSSNYLSSHPRTQIKPMTTSEIKYTTFDHMSGYKFVAPRVFCMGTVGEIFLKEAGCFGVICFCHNMRMSVAKFCEHSGSSLVNPAEAIHLENGQTIAEWRKLFFLSSGIRVANDSAGWDWPENTITANNLDGSWSTNVALPKYKETSQQLQFSGGFGKVDGCLKSSPLAVKTHLRQTLSGNLLSGISSNVLKKCSGSLLQPANDGHCYNDLLISKSPLNNGKQSADYQFLPHEVKSNSVNQTPLSQATCGMSKNSLSNIIPFTSSNVELSLRQPCQRSGSFLGTTTHVKRPHLEQLLYSEKQNPHELVPVPPRSNVTSTKEQTQQNLSFASRESINPRKSTLQLENQNGIKKTEAGYSALWHKSPNAIKKTESGCSGEELNESSLISLFLSHLNTFEGHAPLPISEKFLTGKERAVGMFLNSDHCYEGSDTNMFKEMIHRAKKPSEMNEINSSQVLDGGKGLVYSNSDCSYNLLKPEACQGKILLEPEVLYETLDDIFLQNTSEATNVIHCRTVAVENTDERNINGFAKNNENCSDQGYALVRPTNLLPSSNGKARFSPERDPSGFLDSSRSPFLSGKHTINSPHYFPVKNTQFISLKQMSDVCLRNHEHIDRQNIAANRNNDQVNQSCPLTIEMQRKNLKQDPTPQEDGRQCYSLPQEEGRQCYSCLQQDYSKATENLLPCYRSHSISDPHALANTVHNKPCRGTASTSKIPLCPGGCNDQCQYYHVNRNAEPLLLRFGSTEGTRAISNLNGFTNMEVSNNTYSKCRFHEINVKRHIGNICVNGGHNVLSDCSLGHCCHAGHSGGFTDHIAYDNSQSLHSPNFSRDCIKYDASPCGLESCKKESLSVTKYHSTAWRDVPGNTKQNSHVDAPEKPIGKLQNAGAVEEHDRDARATNFSNKACPETKIQENEVSHICSGYSAPSLTDNSVQINGSDSCNLTINKGKVVQNPVDEGSGNEKCCSSDMTLVSKTGLKKQSYITPFQSLGDHRNTFNSKCSSKSVNFPCRLQAKPSLTVKKEKMTATRIKKLDSSKLDSVFSPIRDDLPNSTDQTEYQLSSSKEDELLIQPSNVVDDTFSAASKASGFKRKRSSIDCDEVSSHERCTDSRNNCDRQRPGHKGDNGRDIKRPKFISLNKMKRLHLNENQQVIKRLKPVVLGNSGIIGNRDCSYSRPAKFISLRSILKNTAKLTTLGSKEEICSGSETLEKESCKSTISNANRLLFLKTNKNEIPVKSARMIQKCFKTRGSMEENPVQIVEKTCGSLKSSEFHIHHKPFGSKRKIQTTLNCEFCESCEKDSANKLFQLSTGKYSCKNCRCQPTLSYSDPFCCVCGSSNKDDNNCLIECSKCYIKVHQACYGTLRVPKGHWCCRPCRNNSKNTACVLCGYEGGAMTRAIKGHTIIKSLLKAWKVETVLKPVNMLPLSDVVYDKCNLVNKPPLSSKHISEYVATEVRFETSSKNSIDSLSATAVLNESGSCTLYGVQNSITSGVFDPSLTQWVHMVCGLWTPGTRCLDVDTMSTFDVSGASISRKNTVCVMCNRPGGSCIKCRLVGCSAHFHPWCAHQKGLLQSEIEGIDNESVGFYGRCSVHAFHFHQSFDAVGHSKEDKIPRKDEFSCARIVEYKCRIKESAFLNGKGSSEMGDYVVPQEQLNAWIYINGQKLHARELVKFTSTEAESDCQKEYARYRQAKGWKQLVVYKSRIHALGLYTSLFIPRGSMVVEYVGEIVGLRVADRREIEYESGNKLQYESACYFFRIDKNNIIDATRKGGIARFVNHSCLPNCVAKVISVANIKKVVFFADRDVYPGEEITYDYNFNHEDEGKKIPCFCNSKNCRRYLN